MIPKDIARYCSAQFFSADLVSRRFPARYSILVLEIGNISIELSEYRVLCLHAFKQVCVSFLSSSFVLANLRERQPNVGNLKTRTSTSFLHHFNASLRKSPWQQGTFETDFFGCLVTCALAGNLVPGDALHCRGLDHDLHILLCNHRNDPDTRGVLLRLREEFHDPKLSRILQLGPSG